MRQASLREIRKGQFLQSFDLGDFDKMLDACSKFEKAMKRNKIDGEIVYAQIQHGKYEHNKTWQIYLISER